MNMMIMSRIIYIFLTALAVWSCSPETQGYVIPGPNQTITPTPVHEEQDPVKPALEFHSISCGPGEDASVSREGRFRTAGASKWSCCIISDFHSYTPLPARLSSAMGMIDEVEAVLRRGEHG